ncbi:MAG: hypothetical protein HY655_10175, partial [Acidobacteria bacterium]|nr:hypothetical protein [Acidobacteriota bacterium]
MAGRALMAAAAAVFLFATAEAQELFQTSDRCFACHNTLATSAGEDISIGLSWRASMMANSARDPYWQAGVRREVLDHPESRAAIEEECSKCHMPMAHVESRVQKHEPEVFAHLDFGSARRVDRLAQDGVSCSACHQIRADNLGTRESFVGGFVIDTTRPLGQREEFGPYEIEKGENRIMRSSSGGYQPTEGKHVRQSELCATCHTLITTALGPKGEKIGELPEQMPYQEWLNSDFRETESCQSCHMPVVQEPVRMTSALGQFREGVSRHVFVGGNFFVQRMLNRYRGELGAWALPQEFESAAARTVEHLQSRTAALSVDRAVVGGGRLEVDLAVRNLTGHKFPTAYPSRRAWLHITIRDGSDRVVFESGALGADGSIVGNENDGDPARFEPHYTAISDPTQVQIYEDIMVGADGVPTTGLLTAVRFVKDNRLLPSGFDKRRVEREIAPQGGAIDDEDFAGGGDRIRYAVPLGGAQAPFTVDAELWFQPIAFRWAANLKAYDAAEPQRFTRYYGAMSSGSAVVV